MYEKQPIITINHGAGSGLLITPIMTGGRSFPHDIPREITERLPNGDLQPNAFYDFHQFSHTPSNGTDVPYFSLNLRQNLHNWRNVALYYRLQVSDGSGVIIEGMLPLNADAPVGAGVGTEGEPYNIREWHFREYLGLPRNPLYQNAILDFDYHTRRDKMGPGLNRTFNETMQDWFMEDHGYNYKAKFGPGGTADGDIQSASATQAVLDKYMVDVDFCFIDLSHPGLDLRLNSVIHSDAIKFTQEDKDAIETSADGATTFLDLTDTPAAFGTAGQVPAVNTAGDGMEFVDQMGGDVGTDDQTATEVPVTATGFTGNLSGTDTDVQTALDTIDAFILGSGGTGLTQDQVDARITLLAALLAGATFTGPVHAVTPTAGNNSTQLATTEFVADGFHGASFNNFNRHLVLSRLGGGTVASLPLTFLNAFQGVDPIAAAEYHQGDTVKVAGNIYQYTANVSATIATSAVATDTRFDNLTSGGTGTALEWQDEGTDLAAVTSVNIVGLGVSSSVASGVLTITVAGGTTPGMTHDLYVGWSPDTTVTESEVLAGQDSDTASAVIPTATGSQFLWVWRSDTDGGDPTEVHIAGGGNQRNIFEAATALTVSGNAGQLIVSAVLQNAGLLSGETVRVV